MKELELEIEIKRLDYLFSNLLSGLVAILSLSTIIYFSFRSYIDSTHLNLWFSLNIFLLTLRLLLLLYYKKSVITQKNIKLFYIYFTILAMLSAVLFGLGAVLILPEDVAHQMILLLLIAGLTSGSSISFSSKIEIFYPYLLIIMIPYILTFYFIGGEVYTIISGSMLLWTFILAVLSKKASISVSNNILLAFENQKLISQLQEKIIEADNANRAKSDFLSVMSHEIRTPLNAIMGFVQILLKKETDAKKTKYLETIDKSSKILTNVINDILDITKIESGKLSLEKLQFNPKDEFNSIHLLFEQNALEKNINLINSISTSLPEFIVCDVLRIKQILSNLLSNAIKFTPNNSNIEFVVNFDRDKSLLHFEIKDEGIGISTDNIKVITKAFTQADTSTARKYGGTGLGLSIVTELLKLFDSQLIIESELNRGSSFSFDLKVATIEQTIEPVKTDVNTKTIFNDKKILVAEDNKTNQMLISIILDDLGIESVIADDGLAAENIFKSASFDLVLMDINMPNKNGQEAMQDIKKYGKIKEKKTPIIALTANAVSGDKEKYLNAGFDDYLAKPINIEELTTLLKQYL